MLEEKQRTIGKVSYKVTQLPAPAGRRLLVLLYKVLGPTLGAALRGLPEGPSEKFSLGQLETSAIGEALTTLATVLSADDLDHVCEVFAETTLYSPEPGKWLPLKDDSEFHWAGRYHHMFAWIAFALEVNYAAFLAEQGGLGEFVSAIRKKNEPESDSRPKSIGNSIESRPPHSTQ